ncbi:MAG: hypothetical protein RL685_4753 [Pseudomonadota bacterium]|jgi:hypothetical protein
MGARRASRYWCAAALTASCCWVLLACGSGSSRSALDDGSVLTSGGGSAGTSAGSAGSSAGTSGAAPLSDGERFLADYASSVCALYEPCCQSERLGFSAEGCTDWFARVTAAYLPDQLLPEAGAACLAALAEARAQDPDRCNNVAAFDEATLRAQCEQALVAPAREGAPLGGECLLASDCAAAAAQEEGQVICYGGSCVLERHGAAGDGPCYAGGDIALAQEMYTCAAADGVYCHRANNVCTPHASAGEYCPFGNACGEDAMCIGGTCRALPGEGETCLNAVAGAGGYCRTGTCDRATLLCGPGLAEGEACSETRKCAQGVCLEGSCARSDWQRNLNCVGRASR